MLNKTSLLTMDSFLSSSLCTSQFTLNQMLGAMTSFISCPEYIEEANLEELIAGNTDEGFIKVFEPGPVHHAWIDIFNQIDTALEHDNFSLTSHYHVTDCMEQPSQQLSQWCQGYLKGTQLTQSIWQEDFNLLDTIPDFKKGHNLILECDACLNLIAMFADWDKALEANNEPKFLKSQVLNICSAIEQGVVLFYQLGISFNEIKIDAIDFDLLNIDKEIENLNDLGVFTK